MSRLLLLLLLLLFIPSTLLAQDDLPRYEDADCVVEVPAEFAARVRCGTLTVSESRAENSDPTKTIRLPVAIIASSSASPAPDPLIFPTTGGPGGTTLGVLEGWLNEDWVLNEHDVILIEQRGTRFAEPNLNCPEYDAELFTNFTRVQSNAEEGALEVAAAKACRDRLVAQGIDLTAYTSAESASDLADLRLMLGYDQWNLYGISYGGRLAMTVMRDHPEGLRAVILDSPYVISLDRYENIPPSFAQALDTLFAGCAADAECGTLYLNLEAEYYAIIDRANQTPLRVTISSPITHELVEVKLTGYDLTNGVFDALYSADSIRILPFAIDQLYQNNQEVALPLAQEGLNGLFNSATGMSYSVECAEEMPFNNPDEIAAAYSARPALASFTSFLYDPEVCEVWDVPAAPSIENEPVVSAIPTLLLVGEYDPIHPAFWSEAAAETLSQHYLYQFPGVGHGQITLGADSCPMRIAGEFLQQPDVEPDASCIAEMHAPDFLTTNDIYPTSAIYRLNSDLLETGDPFQIALLAACLIVLVVALVYCIITLLRRRSGALRAATVLAVISAGFFLAFVIGLVYVLFNTDFLILGFGLPASARWLLLLPFAGLFVSIILLLLIARAWLRRSGGNTNRLVLSFAAITALVFAVWLFSRGLLRL